LNSDGDCALREAIQAANTDSAVDACPAGSGADTIVVPAGTYTLSVAGAGEDANATGDLDITADLTINGAGAATTVIDAADLDRVIEIGLGVTAEISGLTMQNGSAGAAGGIHNGGSLTISNSVVRDNTATPGHGGGIANAGGGALSLTLNDSTVSGNTANASAGGGIVNFPGNTTALNRSTVSGNSSNAGGGILNDGTLALTNSTVSGNTDSSAQGGGIWQAFAGGTLQIQSSTVSGNTGRGIGHSSGVVTLKNTILANSTAADCSPVLGSGSVISLGHNLIENNACVIGGNVTGNIIGSDPMLGPLANHGGPTQTHALLAGSPAIDAGSPDCPPPATDQRGVSRPQGAACDIGAFELESEAFFLVIDEDSIDNGNPPNFFSDTDVNDDIATLALRSELPFFNAHAGSAITLHTGQVGDEGWFAPKTIPPEWDAAGPSPDGLRNYVGNPSQPYPHNVGSGLGTGPDPEKLLDKVADVTPLRATGLGMLAGRTVCAVVYDSDVSINYGPLNGSLKGATLGTVAFEVGSVTPLTGFSSGSLPQVEVTILDAEKVCEGTLALFTDAPEPTSSSEPYDTGQCTDAPAGLVSWWPADGDANDIADSNDGTLQLGATFAAGQVDQAFSLDGTNDFVLVPHNANLAFGANQDFTIDAWVNLQAPVANHDDAIVFQLDIQHFRTGVSPSGYGFFVGRDTYEVQLELISSNAIFILSSSSPVPLNAWTHVAAVREGSVGRIYIDGVLDSSAVLTAGTVANSDPFAIGGHFDTQFNPPVEVDHTFGGLIDEVEIFDRALSSAEIAAIFDAGSAGKCKPGEVVRSS